MFAPSETRLRKHKRKCCVEGCDISSHKNPEICFHKFPEPNQRLVYVEDSLGNKKQMDQLTAWTTILKIKDVNKNMKVCSLHFTKEDFHFPGKNIVSVLGYV